MRARMPQGYGKPDMSSIMRQAQKMQEEVKAKQDELEAKEYTGTASGELVKVVITGKHQVVSVNIQKDAVDPDDIEMLEDLVAAAFNSAVHNAEADAESELGKITGRMNIPGLG